MGQGKQRREPALRDQEFGVEPVTVQEKPKKGKNEGGLQALLALGHPSKKREGVSYLAGSFYSWSRRSHGCVLEQGNNGVDHEGYKERSRS